MRNELHNIPISKVDKSRPNKNVCRKIKLLFKTSKYPNFFLIYKKILIFLFSVDTKNKIKSNLCSRTYLQGTPVHLLAPYVLAQLL